MKRPVEIRLRRTANTLLVFLVLFLVMQVTMAVSQIIMLVGGDLGVRMAAMGYTTAPVWRMVAIVGATLVQVIVLYMVAMQCWQLGRGGSPFDLGIAESLRWCARLLMIATVLSLASDFYAVWQTTGTLEIHMSMYNLIGVVVMYLLANISEYGLRLQPAASEREERESIDS